MEDQEFQQKADHAIQALYSKLADASDDFEYDVDLNSGALSIEFDTPRDRFVVSPNSPVRQIWVSAHVQSFKLDWDAVRSAFVLPATGQSLEELIAWAIQKHIPAFSL
jgi:CyaY protein